MIVVSHYLLENFLNEVSELMIKSAFANNLASLLNVYANNLIDFQMSAIDRKPIENYIRFHLKVGQNHNFIEEQLNLFQINF